MGEISWDDLHINMIVYYEHHTKARRLADRAPMVRRGRIEALYPPSEKRRGQVVLSVLNADGSVHARLGRVSLSYIDSIVSVERQPVSDGTMPCPVPGPTAAHRCTKSIPEGWTVGEGHGGGHFWITDGDERIMRGGHFDARAALSLQPFNGHLPEDCPGQGICPYVETARWMKR